MRPDPKPEPRVKDVDALRVARLSGDECVACGGPPGSVHHVIPKGERGDDVPENLVLLCGDGTKGCHGAEHGNPYAVGGKRRDAEWVHRRIGNHLLRRRHDVVQYVVWKLGPEAGVEYLRRRYYLEVTIHADALRAL